MTNRFKNLDTIQLSEGVSPHGEIVTTIVSLTNFGTFVSSYQWKCKNYSKSTSVNAFLMHRGICREFSDENRWVPENHVKSVKRIFGDAVQLAYWICLVQRDQHSRFTLELSTMELIHEPVDGISLNPLTFSTQISKEMMDTLIPESYRKSLV